MKLEVGGTYELNSGEVYECTKMRGCDPLAVDEWGYGPFVIDGTLYHQDGRFADDDAGSDLSVKRRVDTPEIGTLKELNVKAGDVVEGVYYGTEKNYTATVKNIERGNVVYECGSFDHLCGSDTFRIVSRAPDTPKTWGDMTDEEKGALLLAEHEGKVIQLWHSLGGWVDSIEFGAVEDIAYRVRPEPVREVVELFGGTSDVWGQDRQTYDTHRITFETVDGKPDCATIKMEEL